MHEVEGDLARIQRSLDGSLVSYVDRQSGGASEVGSTTRDRDDVVMGLDKRTRQLPPDEPACSNYSDSHVSTMHHDDRRRVCESVCYVSRRRGDVTEIDSTRLKASVAFQSANEVSGAADAPPVVVPQRRDQPRMLGREHQRRE